MARVLFWKESPPAGIERSRGCSGLVEGFCRPLRDPPKEGRSLTKTRPARPRAMFSASRTCYKSELQRHPPDVPAAVLSNVCFRCGEQAGGLLLKALKAILAAISGGSSGALEPGAAAPPGFLDPVVRSLPESAHDPSTVPRLAAKARRRSRKVSVQDPLVLSEGGRPGSTSHRREHRTLVLLTSHWGCTADRSRLELGANLALSPMSSSALGRPATELSAFPSLCDPPSTSPLREASICPVKVGSGRLPSARTPGWWCTRTRPRPRWDRRRIPPKVISVEGHRGVHPGVRT